jgi:hypothetical protein
MMNDANEQLLGYMYLGMGEFDHADLGAQGLTPLREGVGVRTPMPDYEPPDGVQLQDSFTADLDSFFSLSADLFHVRPQSPAPAPASGERMESPAKSFAGLRLVIEKHNVHKVEVPAEHHNGENREYTVSNLKTFKMEVALVNSSNELARDVHVALHASLLYENEQNVLRPNDGEPILIGETKVLIIGGRAHFRLKVGPTVLTTKHEKQRFRVSIAPNSEHLRIQFPQLTVLSEPFKSVTKLDRKPPAASSCTVARPVAAAPSAAIMGQRGPLRQPVARTAVTAVAAATRTAVATAPTAIAAIIPSPTSAESMEARLRAELTCDRLLTWTQSHRVPPRRRRSPHERTSLLRPAPHVPEAQGTERPWASRRYGACAQAKVRLRCARPARAPEPGPYGAHLCHAAQVGADRARLHECEAARAEGADRRAHGEERAHSRAAQAAQERRAPKRLLYPVGRRESPGSWGGNTLRGSGASKALHASSVPGAGSSPRTRLGEANLPPTRPSPAYLWHDILTTSQPWYIYNSGMNIVSSFSYLSAARTWRIKFSCLKYIRVYLPGWLPL